MRFVDLVVEVHRRFEKAGIRHAFGGALALAYAAQPRGTVDIDVNVFLPPDALEPVSASLTPLGYSIASAVEVGVPIAGIRFEHHEDPFPIDVFPALHERYAETERRVVMHPFGGGSQLLPFLSVEDLCVFKLSFGRPKDWIDLAAVADGGAILDVDYVESQLLSLRGPTMHPVVARFRALLRARA